MLECNFLENMIHLGLQTDFVEFLMAHVKQFNSKTQKVAYPNLVIMK
jgi:hypothetical protein